MEQAFVSGAGMLAKIFLILKVHVHRPQPHHRTGNLGRELQRDAFLRLDVQDQLVGHQVFDRRIAEEHERRTSELYHDMSVAHRHALARAQEEGNVGPAPVVDGKLHRDEGFGAGVRGNIGL